MNILFILPLIIGGLECPYSAQESYDFLKSKYGISQTFAEFSEATTFSISDKCIEDTDLLRLCPLKNITQLDLFNDGCKNDQSTRITGTGLDALALLPTLEHLDLDGNKIRADQLIKLKGVKNLKSLKLYDNDMKNSAGLEALADLPNLQYLTLDKNNFHDEVFENLKPLCALETEKPLNIFLRYNRINGSGLNALQKCKRPLYLDLSASGYAGIKDIGNQISVENISGVDGFENLVKLDLKGSLDYSNTPSQTKEWKIISSSPKLKTLDLSLPRNLKNEALPVILDSIINSISLRKERIAIFGMAGWNISSLLITEALKRIVKKADTILVWKIDIPGLIESDLKGPLNIVDTHPRSDLSKVLRNLYILKSSFDAEKLDNPNITKAEWLQTETGKLIEKDLSDSVTAAHLTKEAIEHLQKNEINIVAFDILLNSHVKVVINDAGEIDMEKVSLN